MVVLQSQHPELAELDHLKYRFWETPELALATTEETLEMRAPRHPRFWAAGARILMPAKLQQAGSTRKMGLLLLYASDT